jgi:hypothetical protein
MVRTVSMASVASGEYGECGEDGECSKDGDLRS